MMQDGGDGASAKKKARIRSPTESSLNLICFDATIILYCSLLFLNRELPTSGLPRDSSAGRPFSPCNLDQVFVLDDGDHWSLIPVTLERSRLL